MKTINDRQHAWLLRRFHTLCTRLGLESYEKLAMVESCGVTSSRDLTCAQLEQLCSELDIKLNPELKTLDDWRKRVMASIGGWLRTIGRDQNAQIIKQIACRATGHHLFNEIPIERLMNIYYSFLKKQKDFKAIEQIANEELEILSYLN